MIPSVLKEWKSTKNEKSNLHNFLSDEVISAQRNKVSVNSKTKVKGPQLCQ